MKPVLRQLRSLVDFIASYESSRVQSQAQAEGQRSIVIVGARRSGHHAIIFWLANSLENREVEWKRLFGGRHFVSQSNQTVHINDWNVARHRSGGSEFFRFRTLIRNARFLLVNYEDQDPALLDRLLWFPKDPHLKILVTRSTLNLVASRLAISVARPKAGPCPVDEPFFEKLMAYRHVPSDWVVVDFDSWLRNEDEYRSGLAHRIGAYTGTQPVAVSHFGGGSSFTGMEGVPSVADLTNRYAQISWPVHVVKMLLEDRFSELLTSEERKYLNNLNH